MQEKKETIGQVGEIFDFYERLKFSQGICQKEDTETIKKMIVGCIKIVKTNTDDDLTGIDYYAYLRGGREIAIDAKRRDKGASKYWKNGHPELALEIWSAIPTEYNKGKTGWTLDESKQTELVLFTFEDIKICYLISFQLLRIAFIKYYPIWKNKYFLPKPQNSGKWKSQCIFIPITEIFNAIQDIQKSEIA